ncbi:MAG: hypothetical protein EXS37_09005 [Opitutus sp.]|nr:hypothetical protein [Opitutus sp.]
MNRAFLIALTVIINVSAVAISHAANTKPIEDVFQRYWGAYSRKDLAKAATDILPSDLEELKTAVLPVFVSAQSSKNKEAQEILSIFFGRTAGKARESLSGVDVYSGLNRLVMAGDPQMFDVLKDASISIIFVRTPSPDEAEIHFQVTLKGQADTDVEGLINKNGRWWIRLKDQPKETAAHFKELFAKG